MASWGRAGLLLARAPLPEAGRDRLLPARVLGQPAGLQGRGGGDQPLPGQAPLGSATLWAARARVARRASSSTGSPAGAASRAASTTSSSRSSSAKRQSGGEQGETGRPGSGRGGGQLGRGRGVGPRAGAGDGGGQHGLVGQLADGGGVHGLEGGPPAGAEQAAAVEAGQQGGHAGVAGADG